MLVWLLGFIGLAVAIAVVWTAYERRQIDQRAVGATFTTTTRPKSKPATKPRSRSSRAPR